MRAGGGKHKGSAFERRICIALSLWITGGKNRDCLWRSAMSGGRATVGMRKGQVVRQAGDICAVSPEGHAITDIWYLECKFYRQLRIEQFVLFGRGPLASFWKRTEWMAERHKKAPVLIAKQNNLPTVVVTGYRGPFHGLGLHEVTLHDERKGHCSIYLLADVLKLRYDAFERRLLQ